MSWCVGVHRSAHPVIRGWRRGCTCTCGADVVAWAVMHLWCLCHGMGGDAGYAPRGGVFCTRVVHYVMQHTPNNTLHLHRCRVVEGVRSVNRQPHTTTTCLSVLRTLSIAQQSAPDTTKCMSVAAGGVH